MSTDAPPRIDPDALVDMARERTGLDDLGGDTCRAGLDRLADALNDEARLSELGAAITPDNLAGYLVNRLLVTDWHAQNPGAAGEDIGAVVFMIGMGRTGTTILQDLLAQDPASRVPRTWEVDRPVPPPEPATYETDPRIAEVDAVLGARPRRPSRAAGDAPHRGAPRAGVRAHHRLRVRQRDLRQPVPRAVVRALGDRATPTWHPPTASIVGTCSCSALVTGATAGC